MTKKLLRLCMLACLSAGMLVSVGCKDKDYYNPNEGDTTGVGKEASTLDFSTSQTVKLKLNFDVKPGFVSVYDIYTKNPFDNGVLRTDIQPIAGGIDVAGTSEHTRVIPSHITELYLYSPSLFVPLLSYAKIENGVASFQDIGVDMPQEPETRAGNAGNFWQRPISHYLKRMNDYYQETEDGHYKYDLKEESVDLNGSIPAEVMTAIATAFPESKRLFNTTREEFIQDVNLHVVKGAKVYVSILYAGCSINNSLSYFVYTGDKDDFSELTKEEVAKLELINLFQLADTYTNKVRPVDKRMGVAPGKYVQLLYKNEAEEYVEDFPAGAKIGWKLHRMGFQPETFTAKENAETLFSVTAWNDPRKTGSTVIDNRFTIYFQATDNNGQLFNCFGFEDVTYKPDDDFNDLIFHVLTDPSDALAPPPTIDDVDENIENIETKKGILAFEDNWPEKGDYDLNDVVVKYNSTIAYRQTGNSDAFVKRVEDKFSLIHSGADFKNAFSYKVDLSPRAIEKITITTDGGKIGVTEVDYTSKITADGNGFIIDLCPNVLDAIDKMTAITNPQNYTVLMEFVDGAVSQNDFSGKTAPYNPFIIAGGNYPNAEVHLPMYPPTSRADMNLFGTEDDRSNKNTLWYVSGTNNKYPFAIHLDGADNFKIPVERQLIDTTYPNFAKWVDSDMTEFKDWYN
ncbi:LruC domain-containing protein [Bacteroides sp. OttesenSCG-928-N06]|nr:LruC domain-containing protein [Bacteroides sp. OttesenSCG-928-N06]